MVIIGHGHLGKVGQGDGGSLQLNPIGSYSESFSSISHFGLSYIYLLKMGG